MKTIQPDDIPKEIIRLIDEAKETLVLVSPFVDFTDWANLRNSISSALARNVKTDVYILFDENNFESWSQINNLGIQPKFVSDLDSNLYYNENNGILSSFGLSNRNISPVEFGLLLQKDELSVLRKYVEILETHTENENSADDFRWEKEKFILLLQDALSAYFEREIKCRWNNGKIEFNAGTQYYVELNKKNNQIYIDGIITDKERNNYPVFEEKFSKGYNATVKLFTSVISAGLNKKFSSSFFDSLFPHEKKEIINFIRNFVIELRKFKENRNSK